MSELRSELWEKEMKLTDIRLEALNSAHQLEQLRETMHNMQVRTLACLLSVPVCPQSLHLTTVLHPRVLLAYSFLPCALPCSAPAGGGSPEG